MTMDPTKFNIQKQKEAMDAKKTEIVVAVGEMERKGKALPPTISAIQAMDFLEECLRACGGEQKANFLEVGHSFVKVFTRMPMSVNLFPFLPEGTDNPRFHKTVTKLLIQQAFIKAVRWVPQDGGAILLVDLEA